MNRVLLLLSLLFLSIVAESQTPLVQNGFYRARNQTTQRYISVVDDYGRIDYQSTSADMGAIVTYNFTDDSNWNYEKILSNPATIVYTEYNSGANGYNLYCQGTNTYSIVASYLKVSNYLHNGKSAYQMYASKSGVLRYLNDAVNYGENESYLDAGSFGDYSHWDVLPISTTGDNYFGMLPTCSVGDDHYLSFYASFPYSFYSDGMKGYYINIVDKDLQVAVIKEIGTNKTDIPGGMPIIVKCSSSNPSNNRLDIHTSATTLPNDNLLKGVYFCSVKRQDTNPHNDYVENDPNTMRVIGVLSDGSIGMKKYGGLYIPQNTAYLQVPVGTPDELKLVTEDEYENMKDIKVTSISLNQTEIANAEVGQQIQLIATLLPNNATNKTVTWRSSNESVVTVDANGLIKIVAEGEAVITAATTDGSNLSATCKVTVPHKAILATDISLNKTEIANIEVGEMVQLLAVVLPSNADNKVVTWSSSNENIATVDANGLVTIVGDGEVIITAKTTDGSNLSATCKITVPHIAVLSGDANGDGFVDVSDITAIASFILGRQPDSFIKQNADANQDGYIDVSDITYIASIILGTNVLLGDANNDKNVDVSDITAIAAYILGTTPDPFNAKNADANKDGNIDVSDITTTAGFILH